MQGELIAYPLVSVSLNVDLPEIVKISRLMSRVFPLFSFQSFYIVLDVQF